MRVPGEGRALRPPTLGWLLRVWIELEELLCDFSLKPFVGPTTTPQGYYEMAYPQPACRNPAMARFGGDVTAAQRRPFTTRHGP